MGNRYWVGGTASWDATAGSKWALTSGGAGGQAVPTAADDVFFDAASGTGTVTVNATANCLSIDFTGYTGTFAGSSNLNIFGSFTLATGMTNSFTGFMYFNSTTTGRTITTAGKTVNSNLVFQGVGGGWTLQDAFNGGASSSIDVQAGTFTSNNFNITVVSFSSNVSSARTINLGSSTITLSQTGTAVQFATTTNLTLNAGTSTIIINPSTGGSINCGGTAGPAVSLYNVRWTGASVTSRTITGAIGVTPAITFNNIEVVAPATAGVATLSFASNTTINGTLSSTSTAGNRRVLFQGLTYGIAQTLTINSAPSLTDADFRDIYVIGTSAPISGTRIGNLRGCSGITFSTPKTVYWNLAGAQNWSANAWATTSTGTPSTDNFPLAQDTATFTNAGSITGVITFDAALPYTGTVDMSGRTSAATFVNATNFSVYGDWTFGSGITLNAGATFAFNGRNTQTITSAGKTFNSPLNVDSYGGTVQLADALNLGTNNLTVTNGTFDTKNFSVTASILSSGNTNVRTINLGSSTVTLSNTVVFSTPTNLTLNAGTSTIVISSSGPTFQGSTTQGLTFYNVSFTSTTATVSTNTISGVFTFNNLSFSAPSTAGLIPVSFAANQTINGTLTVAGATAVRRIFVQSDTLGTTRTLTVNTLSATDCDFRDITIAGTAAGSSPTRAGDCGGNTGITFPAGKTVYWNLAGTQSWTATAWCSTSGGTPDINQFPLAQDTAVINDAGAVTQINNSAVNVGSIDFSARTSAVTLVSNSNFTVYGNITLSAAVTLSGTTSWTFSGRGTSTITSAGKTFSWNLFVDCVTGTVQLADALTLSSARTLTLTSGTFDAVTYNVTVGLVSLGSTIVQTLKMGSGTWTLSGTGTVWSVNNTTNFTFYKGTANIVLSDTSTTARTFSGNNQSYNKLTIGGATGTSTTTISGANQFTELASTKTVAHTISGTQAQSFGAWTVTGTAGNVVTLSGTATFTIVGARVSGVDYLALGTTTLSSTSPGEFYAGANSTGGTGFILTAAPTPVTRYWRGGTGTWDATTTTNWSASSGGAGGASVPTSADAVIFDSLSNATAYTVTCTATQLRCGSLTMAGPLTGNVTWAGTAPLAIHDNVSLSATGITNSYTGALTLSGSTTGKTFTPNGVTFTTSCTVNGVGCEWSLGGATAFTGSNVFFTNGSFLTNNYSFTVGAINSNNLNGRSISFGSSTITTVSTPIDFGTAESNRAALTFNAGTSTITTSSGSAGFNGNNQTFYNVSFLATNISTVGTINGVNTFNNFSVAGQTSSGIGSIVFGANQTINGTLTLSAGTNATMRSFVRSNTLGTTRTLTVNAFSGTDVDFRDITVTGTAAPISGTRLGDCKGNSGITFGAGVTRYWNLAAGGNWSATGWAATSGGSPAVNNFPLAQDTALFEATGLNNGATITINAAYNIGTINMSARTANTMTLAMSSAPYIHGNWINGTGTTISGSSTNFFAGRTTQTITSAGKVFTNPININTPGGTVSLQDAFQTTSSSANALSILSGTFNANNYNFTLSGANATVDSSYTTVRTIAIGSGTWTIAGTGTAWGLTSTNLTITGTGTISLTSASTKTFSGGSASYSGITLNQGGAGTLTITGNNTFGNITNSYSATGATTIAMGTTTQTVSSFTATGAVGKVLTIQGSSASSPATLVYTGAGNVTGLDYLNILGVRAYPL